MIYSDEFKNISISGRGCGYDYNYSHLEFSFGDSYCYSDGDISDA